jgi:hypothetical protein
MSGWIQKLPQGQDLARVVLEEEGVTGLPQEREEFHEVGWSHSLLWLLIGMASMASLLVASDEPPLSPVRFHDDLLPIHFPQDDKFLFMVILPTFAAIPLIGRTIAGLVHPTSALQYIGESLIFLPSFGRTLIRWATRAGRDFRAVRRRWVFQLLGALALWLVIHAAVLYRLHETYQAVFYGGVRETWPGHYQEYPWEDLREIRPWCTERRHFLAYDLRFRGKTFSLIRHDRQGLKTLNEIDKTLVGMGKPKRRHNEDTARRCAALWKNTEERAMIEAIFTR